MKSLLVGTLAFYFLSVALAQDAVCSVKESTDLDVVIRDGDTFKYKTSPKRKYGDNIECLVTYELDASCAEMELRCKKINIKNKDVEDCTDGDKLVITNDDEETETVCGKKKKFVFKSSSNMVVEFTSDGKKRGIGAKGCVVTCTKAASAATATAAPTTAAPTTAAPTTAAPTTAAPTTAAPTTGSTTGYSQVWLKGDPEGPTAHVHEGVQLADKSGWVAIGEVLPEENQTPEVFKLMVRAVDNQAATKWTQTLGDINQDSTKSAYSVGFSVIEGSTALYAGVGLWQKSSSVMSPAVVSLDLTTGAVLWTSVLGQGQTGHGGVRSCIMDSGDIVCAGYVREGSGGFKFVADAGAPAVWRLDASGNLLAEKILAVEGMGQVAKIRKDATSGFVLCSTGYGTVDGTEDVESVIVVKVSSALEVEWSQAYGKVGGNSQVFDMLVDNDGNYLLGGHTTIGTGVVNWDYLALKVNSKTKAEEWRRTYGQPRGFDARYIHDEMYGVALDNSGNYLLLGGSGDEYTYSATGSGQWSGWASDTWGSYLVVVTPGGEKLYENFYGTTGGNNAGEWLSYDKDTGDIMVYTDSDTAYGFGFLKLSQA